MFFDICALSSESVKISSLSLDNHPDLNSSVHFDGLYEQCSGDGRSMQGSRDIGAGWEKKVPWICIPNVGVLVDYTHQNAKLFLGVEACPVRGWGVIDSQWTSRLILISLCILIGLFWGQRWHWGTAMAHPFHAASPESPSALHPQSLIMKK